MTAHRSCDEVVGGGPEGIAICVLPINHKGEHDGGAIERAIAEGLLAQTVEENCECPEA